MVMDSSRSKEISVWAGQGCCQKRSGTEDCTGERAELHGGMRGGNEDCTELTDPTPTWTKNKIKVDVLRCKQNLFDKFILLENKYLPADLAPTA